MACVRKPKLIIDCDPGTDDAQAILMGLAHKDVLDLIAVTAVFGNSTVENTAKNAVRILKFAQRSDIPVYKGCREASDGLPYVESAFHGHDGLGDIKIDGVDPLDRNLFHNEFAPVGLTNLASKYPGEITLLCIGPLTNVAAALCIDKEFGKKLKNLIIMGGNFDKDGHITYSIEYNFSTDQQAADNVLRGMSRPIVLLPIDTCSKHYLSWDVYDELVSRRTRTAKFIKNVDEFLVSRVRAGLVDGLGDMYGLWDQLAMSVVLRPECVLEEKLVTSLRNFKPGSEATCKHDTSSSNKTADTGHGSCQQTSRDSSNCCEIRVITLMDGSMILKLLSDTYNYEFTV